MLFLIDTVRDKHKLCNVDEMDKKQNITVCHLSPYNCELSSIEMVRSQIKWYVADHVVAFSIKLMDSLIKEAIGKVTAQQRKNYCHHIEEEEKKRKCDKLMSFIMIYSWSSFH